MKSESGKTPIAKNEIPSTFTKGMTPIEKNIRVVDARGNELEATYPKRAKGLVKKGRARFIDENTICLACPPNERTEDKIMEDIKNEQGAQITEEPTVNTETVQQPAEPQTESTNGEITEKSVLELIDKIVSLAQFNGKAASMFDSVSSDAEQDAYYEAVMTSNTKLHGAIEIQRQTIQALLETANQLLNYLQNKNRKNRVDPEMFLKFVRETAIETGDNVNFEALWNQMN